MKPKTNSKKTNIKQSNISQNKQTRATNNNTNKSSTPTNTSLNQSLATKNTNNNKSLADKFLEYNSNVLDTKTTQREVEPSNNKLYYTNEALLSTACGSPISPQNIDFMTESRSEFRDNQNNRENKDRMINNTNTSVTFKPNNTNNKGNLNNFNTNYGTLSTNPTQTQTQTGFSPQNNLMSSSVYSKNEFNNTYNSNNTYNIPVKDGYIDNNNLNNNEYTDNYNERKEDTISLKTNTQGMNSVMESRSFTQKKPNYYNKLFSKSKGNLNKSCVSLYTNTNKPDNSLIQSIHTEHKLTEKKKIADIFKNLVLRGCSYLDIHKEELFSNASSKLFILLMLPYILYRIRIYKYSN